MKAVRPCHTGHQLELKSPQSGRQVWDVIYRAITLSGFRQVVTRAIIVMVLKLDRSGQATI
ncbi:hypothetical protein TcasGA2_TC031566 [Tribolium castaneum]|uniref:Uncharacterized protein n=1 Tax=Tribolium castaneum TaxID=7070 RepID=A0A139WPU3_TRICA|nr:hypothetical protein TcasGA2_TC031566 [Tribolium castaneum]